MAINYEEKDMESKLDTPLDVIKHILKSTISVPLRLAKEISNKIAFFDNIMIKKVVISSLIFVGADILISIVIMIATGTFSATNGAIPLFSKVVALVILAIFTVAVYQQKKDIVSSLERRQPKPVLSKQSQPIKKPVSKTKSSTTQQSKPTKPKVKEVKKVAKVKEVEEDINSIIKSSIPDMLDDSEIEDIMNSINIEPTSIVKDEHFEEIKVNVNKPKVASENLANLKPQISDYEDIITREIEESGYAEFIGIKEQKPVKEVIEEVEVEQVSANPISDDRKKDIKNQAVKISDEMAESIEVTYSDAPEVGICSEIYYSGVLYNYNVKDRDLKEIKRKVDKSKFKHEELERINDNMKKSLRMVENSDHNYQELFNASFYLDDWDILCE